MRRDVFQASPFSADLCFSATSAVNLTPFPTAPGDYFPFIICRPICMPIFCISRFCF
jgi:hypothetical protein